MRKICLITATLLLGFTYPSFADTSTSKSKTSTKHSKQTTSATHTTSKTQASAKTTSHSTTTKKTHTAHTKKTSKKHHTTAPHVNLSAASDDATPVTDNNDSNNQTNFDTTNSKTNMQLSSAQTAASDDSAENTTPAHHFLWFSWNDNNAGDETTDTASGSPKQVTNLAHQTVANAHYTAYKFGGNRFDPQHGIYTLDCSSYVDHLLDNSSPQAYSTLAQWTGTYKPNSAQYYEFFNFLANRGSFANWDKVDNSQKLQPGDILVFRYKNSRGRASGGHVMLVMDKAVVKPDVVQVKVADSAEAGHSADTRGGRSGIGIGTLLLKVNPATGQPYGFAWRIDSPWNTRVNIAMGRPSSV